MKAQDLRIGNYVQFTTETIYKVDILYDSYNGLEWWKPIPLTEEWLFKFGFVKYGKLHDSYKLNPFIVELGFLGNNYTFRKIMNKNESVLLKELKYVHQLQNLYFELTGCELHGKLNK